MSEPILVVRGLRAAAGDHLLLNTVDLDLRPGTVLAVIGESGSGKTTLGLALQGESLPGVALSGSVRLHDTELLGCTDAQRRRVRAGKTAVLPQHPAGVLNPMRRVGTVLRELAALRHADRRTRDHAVRDAMTAAQLNPEAGLQRRYPHQLSGGQQQRFALAQALITQPGIVVLDEPTTGADTITTSETADMLAALAANGTALVLLTHDLALTRRIAHHTLVLHGGRIVEHGTATRSLPAPTHAHIRKLPAAERHLSANADVTRAGPEPVLRVDNIGRRAKNGTPLISGVDLTVHSGWCAAIIGRSGAGKTTLARCLAGLTRPDTGRILLGDVELAPTARRRPREHRRHVQYIHQDNRAAFDTRSPVVHQVARTAELLRGLSRPDALREAGDALATLGLESAHTLRRPSGLSGGQLQRAALARALLARPSVLICDEITSSQDVVNQSDLLRVLATVKATCHTSIVLISHDFTAVSALADEVHLMQGGRLVESTTPRELFNAPRSELASNLVAADRKLRRGQHVTDG
ncbi:MULTISPECIES: ABC transporter ATP-binding protein [Saccharopolyspora]|uniref:Peptide/nickel transport system ATP-binding protein n=1 Tax=Saccharopolyspora flava TaxID=95161 RepID=A0A1I6UTF9_9PSEU|nr:ATP-binding cassette domain-containing protein [Saccharopolyspora flava]SFT04772.1 peptide/nickel transport system ATP-binding protein [Saccharopolyspora flava]